jgi:phage shock protein A
MSIDEQTLVEERLLLKKDFDTLSDKLRQFELELAQMKGNLNALHGAIQQTDKLIKLCKATNIE